MTPEELKALIESLITDLKTELSDEYGTKQAERDEEWKTRTDAMETKLGEFQESIKKLGQEPPHPPGAIDGDNGDPTCGYDDIGQLAIDDITATRSGDMPERLKKLRKITAERAAGTGFVVGDDERGGYLIPEAFSTNIWKRALELSGIMSRVTVLPINVQHIKLPAMGGYDKSGGTVFGGITFYDEGENDQLQDVRPAFEMVSYTLGLQGATTHASDAMMRFSPVAMSSFINNLFSEGLAWRIEHLLINGTGAGQPTGIINAGCKIATPAETGQTAATVVYENLINMESRIWRDTNAQWVYNRKVLPQLKSLDFAVGAGGTKISKAEAMSGMDEVKNEHCQTLGTEGDISLVDWSQMYVCLPQGLKSGQFDTSIHFKFDYAQTSFRLIYYMDGKFLWRTYETPHYGDTVSPCVTLATRS